VSIYLWLISIVLMGVFTRLYLKRRESYHDDFRALTWKASCTSIPVLLCLYALQKTDAPATSWLLFTGLLLCMAADVLIGIRFSSGTLVFLAAHCCLIAYYLTLAPFSGISVLLFLVVLAGAAAAFGRYLKKPFRQRGLFAAYAAVLVLMLSIAAVLPFVLKTPGATCIAVGAVLFFVSDSLLAANTFGTPNRFRDRLLMYFYYPAVYLLAISAFYM
jgi:Predicted membrane protein